ncbi:hypothetical protein BGZ79_000806, partial [Entomortierella chlamydospora]
FERRAVQNELIKLEHVGQYNMQYDNNGMIFRLQRDHAGHCVLCKREHECDNGYLKLQITNCEVFLHCYRALDTKGMSIGRLPFESVVGAMTAVASQTPSTVLHADTSYSYRHIMGEETPMDEFLAPPLEPLKFGNGKFEITRKHPPSIMLRGETGLGKTFLMEHIVKANKDCKFITISCKRTLANAHEDRLEGFSNYQDLPTGLIACDKLAIQAESLYRLQLNYYNENVILFLDEISSLLPQMTSKTMGDKRDINNEILCTLIKGATRVICLDADLTNEDVQIIKSLRNDVHVIHNQFRPQEGDQVVMYEKKSLLTSDLIQLLRDHKRVWISCTLSADAAKSLHRNLLLLGFNGKCITGDSDEDEKHYISQNIDTLGELDYFIHTPTICVGIDYSNIDSKFDYVVGFFSTQSGVNVETSRQMMRRVRHVTSKTYLIYVDRATSNLPTTKEAIEDWICNQENIVSGAVRALSGLSFRADYGKGLRLIDSFYSRVYINTAIKNNLSANGFMQRFIEQMVHAGCTIQSAQGDSAKGAQILKLQKEMQEEIEWERCERIANAKPLTREAFEKICDVEGLDPEEKYAVVRYRLMAAYN